MKYRSLGLAVLAGALTSASLPVSATNGYFLPGFGQRSLGMGGVGIALAGDSVSQAANPANLAKMEMRFDIGAALFNPVRNGKVWDSPTSALGGFGFHTDNPTTGGDGETSESEVFLMPEMGYVMPFDEKLTFGVAMVGNGGMNTTYRQNFFNFGTTPGQNTTVGVDLMQVLVPVSAAYRVTDTQTVGASVTLAAQRFAAKGLQAFNAFSVTSDPGRLSNNGYDYSVGGGLRLGWQGELFGDERIKVGATWSSKLYMTKFDRYSSLFAERGDFDVPENYGVGLALKPNDDLTVAFDVVRIRYSGIASVSNRGPGTNTAGVTMPYLFALVLSGGATDPNGVKTGLDNGMGFGWTDQTVYKLGVDYALNDKLNLRLGFNYGRSPIPNDQLVFNLLAPATVEKHYTVGFTYKVKDDMEVTGAYVHAASHNQSGCGNAIVDCVDFSMHQNALGVSFGWKL